MSRWLVVIASVRDVTAWVQIARASHDIVDFAHTALAASRDRSIDVPFVGTVIDGWSNPFWDQEDDLSFEIPPYEQSDPDGFRSGNPVAILTFPPASVEKLNSDLRNAVESNDRLDDYALRTMAAMLDAAHSFSAARSHVTTIIALGFLGTTLCDEDADG